MGDFITEKTKCGSCGRVCQQKTPEVYITFGPCDLDTIPSHPARQNLTYEINMCPHCGYVNTKLEKKIKGSKDIILEEDYIAIGKKKYPEAAEMYLKAAYLSKDNEDKFYHYLSAAWAFDDAGEEDNSVYARTQEIEIGLKLKNQPDDFYLILVDLYRKVKQFKEAKELLDSIEERLTGDLKTVAKFQKHLIKKKSALSYNLKEAREYEGK